MRPLGVAGHSSGEMTVAYASSRITAAETIVAAYFRGQEVSEYRQKDAMLAVGRGPDQVAKYLEGRENEVKLAAIHSQSNVTLSGEFAAVDEISAAMTTDSVFNRTLKTGGNAYHSHHMISVGRGYIKIDVEDVDVKQDVGSIDKFTPSSTLCRADALVWYKKLLAIGLGYGLAF